MSKPKHIRESKVELVYEMDLLGGDRDGPERSKCSKNCKRSFFFEKRHFQQGPIASSQPHMKTQMYHRVQGGSDLKKNHLTGNMDGSEPPKSSKNWPKSVFFNEKHTFNEDQ